MFCANCGKQIDDGIQFCNYCGTPTKNNVNNENVKKTNIPLQVSSPADNHVNSVPTNSGRVLCPEVSWKW